MSISCHREGTRFCVTQKIVESSQELSSGKRENNKKRPSIKMEYSQPLLPHKAAMSFTEIKAAV